MTAELTGLLEEARQRGFLGPGPVEDHLDHARAFVVAVGGSPRRAFDLGAGGGLPGLVLAAECWPDTTWVFLDAQQKRTAFLTEAVDELGIADRVTVITERAEVAGRIDGLREGFDLVVARSFGPPAVVAECAAPLLEVGGMLVVSEPPTPAPTDRWPADGLALLGFSAAEPIEVDHAGGQAHLVRITLETPCGDRYPRRTGIPMKRPLF